MTQLPEVLLNKILLFNSHPCADIIRDLHEQVKQFWDYDENDFIESIILYILKPCAQYPYHHFHSEHLLFIADQERAAEEYEQELAEDNYN